MYRDKLAEAVIEDEQKHPVFDYVLPDEEVASSVTPNNMQPSGSLLSNKPTASRSSRSKMGSRKAINFEEAEAKATKFEQLSRIEPSNEVTRKIEPTSVVSSRPHEPTNPNKTARKSKSTRN